MSHSILAPSSAERWVHCPASVTLEQRYPETEPDPAAADGEAAHWAGAEMLAEREPALGARAPNGLFLTAEMIEGAGVYADDIAAALVPFGMTPTAVASEVAVSIPHVHAQCFGTPDARVWLPTPRPTLMMWDFKFGHRIVEVFENWQLICYVSGCLAALGVSDLLVDVIVRIVQPRAYHRDGPVREWRFKASDIRGHVNRLEAAAAQALGPDPQAKAGPHCRDCRARHACPTLQRAGYAAMDEAGKALPLELSTDAMGLELRMLQEARKRIQARESGLEEQILATIRRGQAVPGWAIEHGNGRQGWTEPDARVIAVGRMLGLDLAKPPEAVTPLQATKRGLPAEVMRSLITSPRGAATLVPDDGTRARRVFG